MLRRMDIKTIVIGGGPVTSLLVLKTSDGDESDAASLPIRIGSVEATAISMGVEPAEGSRPMTHDLLKNVMEQLGGHLRSVIISRVEGTTFYASLDIINSAGEQVLVDCRPSDAISLAVRCGAPIYAESDVLDVAGMPDFDAIKEEEQEHEMKEFHDFVEGLSPDDFNVAGPGEKHA
ncbi:MAG: bifunctional nuclease family protein [Tractidigestivibacter sp.]|jgi:bifunctional DNase/RNase|uniref:bifunctional nuclease family protein n=1 Tax=Tractidigestivibacter sp. TaxID=2847320 RepID=UPI003D8C8A14